MDALLDRAGALRPRDQAMLSLYYQAGFTMQRIAQAFGLNRSSVCRALHRSQRKIFKRDRRPTVKRT